MCLQYTDFSRTVIGSFVPVLSDGSLKREVSLSFQDIHSVLLLSSLLCQANRMKGCRRTDGRRRAGGDRMKHTQEFLADHYLTHRQGKAISTATNSYFSPATAFYHSKFLSTTDTEIFKVLRTWGEITKNIKTAIKSDSTCTLCITWITIYCRLFIHLSPILEPI